MRKDRKEKVNIKLNNKGKVKMQFVGKDNKKTTIKYNEDDKIWMLVKMVFNGEELLTIVRDIDGAGYLEDNEVRLDNKYYTEEEGAERIEELSKELGVRAMTSDDFMKGMNDLLENQ